MARLGVSNTADHQTRRRYANHHTVPAIRREKVRLGARARQADDQPRAGNDLRQSAGLLCDRFVAQLHRHGDPDGDSESVL